MGNVSLNVKKIRQQLPISKERVFLNTGWSGPKPLPVIEEQKRVMDWLNREGVSHHLYSIIDEGIEALRGKVARLLGAQPQEVALTHGTTEGINLVIQGLDWQRGDEVLTTNLEHSGGLLPLYNLQRHGVKLRILSLDPQGGKEKALEEFERALGPRTKLALISHISYCTGFRFPIEEASALASERGVLLLIDGAQSAGVLPLKVKSWGIDFYAISGYKWLLGPDSTGALFVHERHLPRLKVNFIGYRSVDSHDLQGNFHLKDSASKLEVVDLNYSLVAGLSKALDFIEGLGMASISPRIEALTTWLKRELASFKELEVITPQPWLASGSLVCLRPKRADVKKITHQLIQRGIIVRWVPEWMLLRVSVNFFQTEEELTFFLENLREILEKTD